MRSFDSGKLPVSEQGAVKKWSCRLLVFGVALGLFVLAAGVATSERSYQDAPVPTSAITNLSSGGGNLVPVF